MIYERKSWSADCDGCGESFCSENKEGFTIFSDEGQLGEDMDSEGWYRNDNRCYCPNCHTINDEDELVLKGKAVKP